MQLNYLKMPISISTNILDMALDLIKVELFFKVEFPSGKFTQNLITSGADISSFVHIDNKKK